MTSNPGIYFCNNFPSLKISLLQTSVFKNYNVVLVNISDFQMCFFFKAVESYFLIKTLQILTI